MPKELIDMVLDCVGRDVPSLKSCSLVSREWLDPARRRLFQTFQVMSGRNTRSFDAFLVFLNYAQGICASVQELHLTGFDTHSHSGVISHYLFRTILDQLPSLQTLSITRCYWSPSTGYSGHALKFLRKLSIRTLFLFDFIHFVDILSLFSSIEELDVCDIKWTDSLALSTPAETPPHDIKQYVTRLSPGFRVGELSIENTENFMAFLWCLKELPFMQSLTTLNIRKLFPDPLDTHPEGVKYFAELLRDTGPTLLNCKIRLPQMYGYWEISELPFMCRSFRVLPAYHLDARIVRKIRRPLMS
ncbi:hypothetical protein PHLCEN_2v5972 [Hermanssonia centrifuga]|uniref:F-box domain-containing protein n=1 Tax=Hermanssonia centrifuga TaxID=98765 RepID=A0A2R6P0U4_9APHY|nr:hypothetical protein PHLCEN_2v5972 [Hermanssonia centrifuga]